MRQWVDIEHASNVEFEGEVRSLYVLYESLLS